MKPAFLKELFNSLSNPFDKCLSCGADCFDKSGICQNCLEYFHFNNGKTCLKCGCKLTGKNDYCGNCAEQVFFDKAYSVFVYEDGIRKVIHSLKFGNNGAIAQVLAKHLADLYHLKGISCDLITYVPMDKSAQKQRGYNQSLLLCEAFCDIINKECFNLLKKIKNTKRQEQLNMKERKENLRGSFAVVDKELVRDKTILIIDDVKTTGSTANECARMLKKSKAKAVYVLTVASVHYKFDLE